MNEPESKPTVVHLSTTVGDVIITEVLNKGLRYFEYRGHYFEARWFDKIKGIYEYGPTARP